jgi:hypothetical protein
MKFEFHFRLRRSPLGPGDLVRMDAAEEFVMRVYRSEATGSVSQ